MVYSEQVAYCMCKPVGLMSVVRCEVVNYPSRGQKLAASAIAATRSSRGIGPIIFCDNETSERCMYYY